MLVLGIVNNKQYSTSICSYFYFNRKNGTATIYLAGMLCPSSIFKYLPHVIISQVKTIHQPQVSL